MSEPVWIPVGPELIRGPQPHMADLRVLMQQGVRGVVNLRSESDYSADLCGELGLAYYHIPVRDWTAPRVEQVELFLQLVEQPHHLPLLVHCLGGVGRTGVFVSCYRISRGAAPEEAVLLSHREVAWMSMNSEQIEFIQAWGRRVRGAEGFESG